MTPHRKGSRMYRVQLREVVIYGKFREYFEIHEKLAKIVSERGWAQMKMWVPTFGKNNEVIFESEYESLQEWVAQNQAWHTDPEVMNLVRQTSSLVYPESSVLESYESAFGIA